MASTTNDISLLRRKLEAADYDPEIYVKEIARGCLRGYDLHHQKLTFQTLSNDTHDLLKKNVCHNYEQFIDTAKDISFLESEMYQLSHLITQQRNVLTSLLQTSFTGQELPSSFDLEIDEDFLEDINSSKKSNQLSSIEKFEISRTRLLEMLDGIEGCAHVKEVASRHLLHDGDLLELDMVENTALHRVHGYILNDSFMIATWLAGNRGRVRFKFSSLYDLENLGIINVKDLSGVKYAFKLLDYTDSRLFQCPNEAAKQEWLTLLNEGIKNCQKSNKQQNKHDNEKIKDISTNFKSANSSTNGFKNSSLSTNPFDDEDVDGTATSTNPFDVDNSFDVKGLRKSPDSEDNIFDKVVLGAIDQVPDWFSEAPDNIEVFIAQRDFEQAVDLLIRSREYLKKYFDADNFVVVPNHSPSTSKSVLQDRIEMRSTQLIQVLAEELNPEKCVQNIPRASSIAITLLIRLDRVSQAVRLFLKFRSVIMTTSLKNAETDAVTVIYVKRYTNVFCSLLCDSCKEFRKLFFKFPFRTSNLIVWTNNELNKFCERIDKQLFSSQASFGTLASCFDYFRLSFLELSASVGLDVNFVLNSKFRRKLEHMILGYREKQLSAVKIRSTEDKWEPMDLIDEQGVARLVEEMQKYGLDGVEYYIYDTHWIPLTFNTQRFTISYLEFVDNILKLFNPGLRCLINESIVSVFHSHLRYVDQTVRTDRIKGENHILLQKNVAFLLDKLLSVVERRYYVVTDGCECPKLAKLHSTYVWLKEGRKKPIEENNGHVVSNNLPSSYKSVNSSLSPVCVETYSDTHYL